MALSSEGSPIYQQIEHDADFYQPAVYQLLQFYHALELEPDPQQGTFVPLTSVQVRSTREVKIFAVGLIPPPVSPNVKRLLDRSASIKALEQPSYDELIADIPDVGSSSTGDLPGETAGIPTSNPLPVGPKNSPSGEFYTQFVVMCNRLGCQPEDLARVIQTESAWKSNAVAERGEPKKPVAKGLIQLIKKTALSLGMTEEQYATFENTPPLQQLPWIEKFYKGRAKGRNAEQLKRITFGGFNNPDGTIYNSKAKEPDFKRPEFQWKAYEQNKASDTNGDGAITAEELFQRMAKKKVNPDVVSAIAQAKASLGMGAAPQPIVQDAPPPAQWEDTGKQNKNKAAATAAQVADKDLNQTALGQQFMAEQVASIRVMQAAIEQIANTPPLRLLVNPQSFRVTSDKILSDGNWGRNGPIIEHWGDNQDKIEGSGKIAAFYSMDASDNSIGPGLTRTARQFSTSYQNLLSLFLLYKNNGGVWLPDPTLPTNARANNLWVVGSVYLYYDDVLYLGSFDSLSISEDEKVPFTLDYTFSFTVRAWYLLDHLDDPQYTYGRNETPSLPTGTGGSRGDNPQPSPEVALPLPKDPRSDPLFGLTTKETIGDDLPGV